MTQPPNAPQMPDSSIMYSNPDEYNRQMIAYNAFTTQQQMQAFAAPMLAQQASFAKAEARRAAKVPAVWTKYADEIEAQMANVPIQARTQEAWEMAAKIVAADHMDELAQARAETLAATPDSGTVTGDGGMPNARATASDPLTQLFLDDDPSIARLKAIGKGAEDAKRAANSMGLTFESYADMLKKSSVVIHSASGTPNSNLEAAHAAAVKA